MLTPKGIPFGATVVDRSVFGPHAQFPLALLLQSAVDHNRETMGSYCDRHGVSIAPHGKTTMAPTLFRRQIEDGAWAITAATTWQAKTMADLGVRRILIANQVVIPAEIEWLCQAIEAGLDVSCYVDSVPGVEILAEKLGAVGIARPLPVLLELGVNGGRTGARTVGAALNVAAAAATWPELALTGVAGFEGMLSADGEHSVETGVAEFLDRIVDLARELDKRMLFQPSPEVVLTAGGSLYFDSVVERFAEFRSQHPTRIVIRSGCYITHDDGIVHRDSPMGAVPRTGERERFLPAIEVWGAVLSRPEPTRVLVGVGKRDASSDGPLPLAKKVLRRSRGAVESIEGITTAALNDQHAYLDIEPGMPLDVGDLIGFGISHPCTTFDKWRTLMMVDDAYRVTELVETYF